MTEIDIEFRDGDTLRFLFAADHRAMAHAPQGGGLRSGKGMT
jgi:hypothetical protein